MCGIAGFSLKPNSGIDPGVLAASLALGIESRGRDATGCAWFSPSHKSVRYLKEPVPASEYIDDLVNGVDEDAVSAIVHTRASTQGSKHDNVNNHPIVLPGIVGVHNGIIVNDAEVTRKLSLKREAKVDSEVLFHIIRDSGVDAVADHAEGDAAVAWMLCGETQPIVHLALLNSRPGVYCSIWRKGVPAVHPVGVMFASTRQALLSAAKDAGVACGAFVELEDGDYVTFEDGVARDEDPVRTISRGNYKRDWGAADGPGRQLGKVSTWKSGLGWVEGHYENGQFVYDPEPEPIIIEPVREPEPVDELIADALGDDDQYLARRIWNARRAIVLKPLFCDTSLTDWEVEDESAWGDFLLYNQELDTYASWDAGDGTVRLVFQPRHWLDAWDKEGEPTPLYRAGLPVSSRLDEVV